MSGTDTTMMPACGGGYARILAKSLSPVMMVYVLTRARAHTTGSFAPRIPRS
jgi:hypothetical protein